MPEQQHPSRHIGAYAAVLAGLAVIVGIAYVVSKTPLSMPRVGEFTELPQIEHTNEAPQPTANDLAVAQKGFQYLVSYNGSAFLPLRFSAKAGEVVRFANNSSQRIVIAVADMSSPQLSIADYWEYTVPATTTPLIYSADGAAGEITVTTK